MNSFIFFCELFFGGLLVLGVLGWALDRLLTIKAVRRWIDRVMPDAVEIERAYWDSRIKEEVKESAE